MESIRKFYSSKSEALLCGRRYSEQEKQDIYLHKAIIGIYLRQNQIQYSLRMRSEIFNPKSKDVVRCWVYRREPLQPVKSASRTTQPRSTGVCANMPMGASDNPSMPYNEPELRDCPMCDGDGVGIDELPCDLCEGDGIVIEQVYNLYKIEEKQDSEANQ